MWTSAITGNLFAGMLIADSLASNFPGVNLTLIEEPLAIYQVLGGLLTAMAGLQVASYI